MALPFPLIPVLVGAAVGAAVTYIFTARSARKQITDALQELGETVEAGADKVKTAAEDTADAASDAAKKVASKIGD